MLPWKPCCALSQVLDPQPEMILVDGIHTVSHPHQTKMFEKGRSGFKKHFQPPPCWPKSIETGSWPAYHHMYPEYGFDKNKGYGTRQHLEALKEHGPCPVHRLTFKGGPLD